MKIKLWSLAVGLGLWQLVSWWVARPVILPSPLAVVWQLLILLMDGRTYLHIFATFFRAHMALGLALLLAFSLAYLCHRFSIVKEALKPWIRVLQTIPQISFIILLMFMTSHQKAMLGVIGLMLFPVAYHSLIQAFETIDQSYHDLMVLDGRPWYENLVSIYIPLLIPTLWTLLETLIPMSLKVGVMSEVVIYTTIGLGNRLSMARANIEMTTVFAYTLILIIGVFVETFLIHKIAQKSR